MAEPIKMSLTTSLLLDEMVNSLLTKEVKQADGTMKLEDRVIPFRLKYRLTRNKATLDKDYKAYQQKQLMLIGRYGEPTADGTHLEIKNPENFQKYQQDMIAVLDTIVEHSVTRLDPADLENLMDDEGIKFSESMIKLLIAYLVEDNDFIEDLERDIHWKAYEPKNQVDASTPEVIAAAETAGVNTQEIAEKVIEEKSETIKKTEKKTKETTEKEAVEKTITPKKESKAKKTTSKKEVKSKKTTEKKDKK